MALSVGYFKELEVDIIESSSIKTSSLTTGPLTVNGTATYNADINVVNRNITVTTGNIDVISDGGGGALNAGIITVNTVGPNPKSTGFQANPAQGPISVYYTMPVNFPTVNGQVLSCQTDGTLSWV